MLVRGKKQVEIDSHVIFLRVCVLEDVFLVRIIDLIKRASLACMLYYSRFSHIHNSEAFLYHSECVSLLYVSLYSWNPMATDFKNPEVNSYDSGPGALLKPFREHCGVVYTLYVGNVPLSMEKVGPVAMVCWHSVSPPCITGRAAQVVLTCWKRGDCLHFKT